MLRAPVQICRNFRLDTLARRNRRSHRNPLCWLVTRRGTGTMQENKSNDSTSSTPRLPAPNGGTDRRRRSAGAVPAQEEEEEQQQQPSLHLLAHSTSSPITVDLPRQSTGGGDVEDPPFLGDTETRNTIKKKKKEKKKSSSQSVLDSPAATERRPMDPPGHPSASSLAVRPPGGKKTLRKLRHPQQELSPIDFLWSCAQRLVASGHATIQSTTNEDVRFHVDDTPSNTAIPPCPDRIQIATSIGPSLPSDVAEEEGPIRGIEEPITESSVTIRVKPLLVLDLNGILCHRVRHYPHPSSISSGDEVRLLLRPSIATIAQTPIIPRLDLMDFLHFVQQHFCVAVWTSAKAKNARLLLRALLPPHLESQLLFVYAQHHCREHHPSHNHHNHHHHHPSSDDVVRPTTTTTTQSSKIPYVKPLFEKDLSVVWKEFPLWDEHNTVLYDDSPEKCWQWQNNAIHPPPLTGMDLYDEVSERQQREFFERLVEHWRQTPGIKTFHISTGEQWWDRSVRQADFLREEVARLGWTSFSS